MKKILLSYLIVLISVGCATNEPQETPLEVKPKDTYCNPNEAQKLIGHSVPSEAELKKITNAGVVRISRKGQSVRTDLHYDRLSVVIDNESKIIYSNCS
ncbi:hypothetical protein F937_02400 [Acinetobacter calcoaceticus ANC 3680]|uniref:hypothetical protein n=1 Tax=Acinetobacter calcoaceticus TaxID=471 RepID=UPI0002CE1050|nr:hypothetical protein [Acinetobacter calcoaceticus]ENV93001.1 hypothetical protein F937_02400 [Acinetobacter calcoaceticus ANC 3680]